MADSSLDVDVLAAMLRADERENEDYLELLARKLEGALPAHTTVERRGGLFSRRKAVEKITVRFADTCYEIERQPTGPLARRRKVVRGVALSTEELGLDRFTAEMARAIQLLAAESATARAALERFILGR